ncbi:hypothetical protein B7Z28_01835, partial [Candidatus Saccharibacteria bacterium 32-45-3]
INRKALEVSPDALAIDEVLNQASQQAVVEYAPLREQLRGELSKKPSTEKKSSKWHENIAKMRQTHPNAFRPWTKEHDDELKQDFRSGVGLEELSKKFGRHPGSIIVRLKKHFGDDVIA